MLEERKAVITAVDECAAKVTQTPEFQALSADDQSQIKLDIENNKAKLDDVKMIPILRERANSAKLDLLPRILAAVEQLSQPAHPIPGPGQPTSPEPTYINASEIKVVFAKHYLTEEADVEQYVEELKKTLLEQVRAGKKVIV